MSYLLAIKYYFIKKIPNMGNEPKFNILIYSSSEEVLIFWYFLQKKFIASTMGLVNLLQRDNDQKLDSASKFSF